MDILTRLGIIVLSTLLLVSGFAIYVNAADETTSTTENRLNSAIALAIGKSNSVVNGKNKKIDSVPFVHGGRTYVPVRFVSEALGATVSSNSANKSISITSAGVQIKLVIGQKNMTVNKRSVNMGVAPIVKGGRTFLPVKFIAEGLGKNVFSNKSIIIISPSDIKIDATTDKVMIDKLTQRVNGSQIASQKNNPGNFQKPDLTGEVEAISDKQITLKLVEMPRQGQRRAPNGSNTGTNNQSSQNGQTPPSGQTPPEGQAPIQKPDQQQDSSAGQGTPPQQTLTYTGETKTITVDSTVSITTMSRIASGIQSKNMTFDDLKVGDVISVWYSDKDKGTISKIMVQVKNQAINN